MRKTKTIVARPTYQASFLQKLIRKTVNCRKKQAKCNSVVQLKKSNSNPENINNGKIELKVLVTNENGKVANGDPQENQGKKITK